MASNQFPFRSYWLRVRTSLFWMVAIAFGLRVLTILLLHTYKFRTSESNFGFGWEMGRIAESLALGEGFSNPFHGTTGPTAWEPPLTPFLIAGMFKLAGTYSRLSAFLLLVINSFWSALTCVPIFLIARRCFSERVAVGSAWTWALHALRHLLVHEVGVGDEPVSAADRDNFLARYHVRRAGRHEALGRIRNPVGHSCAQ